MKITIKAEAQVPYTTEIVSQDIVIEIYHDREETDKQLLWAAHEVENIVNREVDKQMEARGIKLGPDGLRLPNAELSESARENPKL